MHYILPVCLARGLLVDNEGMEAIAGTLQSVGRDRLEAVREQAFCVCVELGTCALIKEHQSRLRWPIAHAGRGFCVGARGQDTRQYRTDEADKKPTGVHANLI